MVSPNEQFVPNSPSFIFWSLNIGLASVRSTSGRVSSTGRGAVGLRSRVVMSLSPRGSAELEGIPGRAGQLDPYGLVLGVFVERVDAVLAAEPAVAEPAEGHVRREHAVGVDPDGPGAQLGSDPVRPVHVLGPHRSGQAVGRVVGQLEGLFLVAEGE